MAAKKKAVSGNIETRLAALRADFEALQADMKGLYGDVSEVASERAALALRSAEEIADRAVLLAEEAATQAKTAALEYGEDAKEWADGAVAAIGGLIIIFTAGWIYINQQTKTLQKNIDTTNQQLKAQNLAQVQKDAKEK